MTSHEPMTGPRESAAPPSRARRIRLQAGYDTRLTMANGEQLLLTVVIPIGVLLGLYWFPALALVPSGAATDTPRIDLALPGALTVAVLSSAFASLAIATGFDRRSGSLLLLATTPLSRTDLVWARAISTLTIVAGQVLILLVIAAALGWRPTPPAIAGAAFVVVGALSLAACAIMIAGVARAEATLALANGVFLLLLVAGGTAIPASSLPSWWAPVAQSLPSGALADGLRWSLLELPGLPTWSLLALIMWGAAATLVARRTFRWD